MVRWIISRLKGKKVKPVASKNETSKITEVNTPNYTRFMVGTYLDPVHGWMLCQAPFDPVTKEIGEMVTERASGDREILIERLQIKVVNLGLMQPEAIKTEKKEEIY